ncbi:conserved hypothetical protein [Candidatus Desulfosporosinus infrequens]|uniref:Uncharacterized protein n=1 Tax=Candidatus Desulfosporosinus infrequens TaxID=2043169 RepID=A0A2U3LKN1_9FIRM|nr:conserved hypothetical protein [Candidatus Desulfosporosinus infrequens]
MNEVDALIKDKLVPMRKRVIEGLVQKHPHILGMIDMYLTGKNNKIGMRVTENGSTVGEYTFHLSGLQISDVECGVLSSELHHPLGIIKPYAIIEKNILEEVLNDEQILINELFTATRKYLPNITIKFQ